LSSIKRITLRFPQVTLIALVELKLKNQEANSDLSKIKLKVLKDKVAD